MRLANELLEAIYQFPFSGNTLRVVLWIIRQSYGWRRKFMAACSYRAASKAMRMPVGSVHLAMEILIENKVIVRDDLGRLRLNKDYEAWQPVQPTERSAHRTKSFSPLNTGVQPTEPPYPYKEKDITAKDSKDNSSVAPEGLMEVWNSNRGELPKALAMSPGRTRAAKARLSERSLDEWQNVIQRIANSPFCLGRNERGWVASFDWLLRPDTALRVLEGKYDERKNGNHGRIVGDRAPVPGKYAKLG